MTEAEEDWDVLAFRQWAAQRWPARAKFIRDGELDFDYFADAFRAGATASADRIKELEAEVRELMDALNATPQHKTQKAILARIAHKADLAPYRHDDTVAQQRRAPTND